MWLRFQWLGPALLAWCAFVSFSWAADDATVKKSVANLLQVGWATSLDARRAADAALEQSPAADDPRLAYAYALVLIKQGRYAEASDRMAALTAVDKENVRLARCQAWLLMLQKKYPAALVQLEQLGGLVAATKADTTRTELNQEMCRFLGRMYGFLEGPAAAQINADQREKSRQATTDALPETLRPLLDDAAADVIAQFKSLTGEKQATQSKIAAEAEAEREKLLADLDKQEERLVARREELQPRRDKLRSEMKSELSGYEAKDRPLAEALVPANARANAISNEMNLIQIDLNRYRALAAAEKDPAKRESYLRQIETLRAFGLRYSGDLSEVKARIDEIQLRRNEVRARAAEVQGRYANLLRDLESELADLDAQQKKILGQRGQKKPAGGSTARVGMLAAQASALTTYDVFPLEVEKKRLLDSWTP